MNKISNSSRDLIWFKRRLPLAPTITRCVWRPASGGFGEAHTGGSIDEKVAIQLLQKCLISPDLVENKPHTTALLKELTYLPLAIIQAVAYINENGIAFVDFLSVLTEQEEDVATTFLISFEHIRHRDSLAAEYLSFVACISPKDVPQSLLPPGFSRKKEIDALGTPNAYSFITRHSGALVFDVHRLVHLATRNWLKNGELLARWTEKVVKRLADIFPTDDNQNRGVWRVYLPHACCVLESNLVDSSGTERIDLAWKVGLCLDSDGRWKEAEPMYRQTLQLRQKVLGLEHPDTLLSINNLAVLFNDQGNYDEAEAI